MTFKNRISGFWLNVGILTCTTIVAFILVNRAFTISSLVALLFILVAYRKVSKQTALLLLGILLTILTCLVIFVKSDSSLGRLFIYKISYGLFKDNWVTGIGLGNFKREYGLYQAAYFEAGRFTEKEFLLADNVFYAFNDYWQFIIETGSIGIIIVTVSFVGTFLLLKRRIFQRPVNQFLLLNSGLFITISTAALFTHVFENSVFWIFSLTFLFYLTVDFLLKVPSRWKYYSVVTVALTLVLFNSLGKIANKTTYLKLENAKQLALAGYVRESKETFDQLYPHLQDDVSYLLSYSDVLTNKSDLQKKLHLLKLILDKRTDYRIYLRLGETYEQLGKYRNTEKSYLVAANIAPNRVVSKHRLFEFYLRQKDETSARHWGNIILFMPIKIPSKEISAIQNRIKFKMNRMNRN